MNDIRNETREILESLIKSPGWAYVQDLARKEWTERERVGRRTALNDSDDKRAIDKLRQITAAQEAVEWVLNLPTEELAKWKRMESAPLLEPLAAMSRRGSL